MTHTFSSTSPAWYNVKLVVTDGSRMGFYQQALAVEFNPTHFPATPPAGEPSPPNTNPCGTLSSDQQSSLESLANSSFAKLGSVTSVVHGTAPREAS